jgi:hypothetical protein
MIDTARTGYPSDLMRAAHGEGGRIDEIAEGMLDYVKQYAREQPVSAMLWALGIGFVLGWKLKPW